MHKTKANEAKLDDDKKQLRNALDDAENRVTKGEVMRRALEGDLQRLKLALTDKETECQVYQQRVDSVSHQLQDMESKAQSLQLTVDRLSSALAKVEEEECASKTKVSKVTLGPLGQGH